MIKRDAGKISKYKSLTTKIQRYVECENMSDNSNNMGQLDTSQNPFTKYLSNVLGSHEIKDLQKTHTSESTNVKVQNVCVQDTLCHTRALTSRTSETWFIPGI